MEPNNPNINEEIVADSEASARKKLLSIVSICVLSAFVFFACVAGSFFLIDYLGVDTSVATPDETEVPYTEVVTTAAEDDNTTPTLPDGTPYTKTQDFAELKSINPDIVGWIDIPNTAINYPVLDRKSVV